MTDKITEIYADQIIDPVDPIRSELDKEKVFELAESIKREGLINPITVRPYQGKHEVVAGHRRFRACMIAGVVKIPCVVKDLTDARVFEIRAHENLFRVDIDPVDEAIYLGKLLKDEKVTIAEIAQRLNRSEQWVQDRLDILQYPDYLIEALKLGKISLGVAKYLGRIEDDVYRAEYVRQAVGGNMSVMTAQYVYNLWKQGTLKSSAELLAEVKLTEQGPRPKVHARCEKCGKDAEEPNLKSVFIHITCPTEPLGSEGQIPTPPS